MHWGDSGPGTDRREPMRSSAREDGQRTTDGRYGLVCRSCPFERTVSGLDPALEWMDRHKAETDDDHSVDVYAFSYLVDLTAELSPSEATELEQRAIALVTPDASATDESVVEEPTPDEPAVDDTGDERTAGDD